MKSNYLIVMKMFIRILGGPSIGHIILQAKRRGLHLLVPPRSD